MKISFCFGNGESRYGIDVDRLNEYGPVYGCNAIYRDWHVDNLVSCDKKIAKEITKNGEHLKTNFYTKSDWKKTFAKYPEVKFLPPLPFVGDDAKWGSGTSALLLACLHQADIVVMFGYDLWSNEGALNNLYKDTDFYPKSTDPHPDPSIWQQQINQIFVHFADTQFVQVQPENWVVPESWAACPNFSLDTRQNLFHVLENMDRY